ncbi:dihydroorotate dehydrogenase [Candidatus Poribacteria bacterium]|nr:MAG: dihydroorotate dehydrogenase [Candidatus Poribacteria bacterium]
MDLSVEYVGLKLKNPVIAASAHTTGTLDNMKRCEDAGAAAVVVKSLFEKEVVRKAPTPRFKLLRREFGRFKTWTFYSYEQASEWGPERYAEEIRRAKESLEIPVIASINCYTHEGWVQYARMMEQAGADALELNVSCPHSSITFTGLNVEEEIAEVTKLVREAVSIPIIVKLSPMLTSPLFVARLVEKAGANGVVMFNRFTGLDIDVESESPIMHGTYAGHGGAWSIYYPLRWISAARPHLRIDICGSGGVMCGEDVAKYILVGADAVQVCTAIYLMGHEVLTRIIEEFERIMERKGYESVDRMKGNALPKILTEETVFREHIYVAEIDPEGCSGCGVCARSCMYSAIDRVDGRYEVAVERCDGCGLCVELCPKGVIRLVRRRDL